MTMKKEENKNNSEMKEFKIEVYEDLDENQNDSINNKIDNEDNEDNEVYNNKRNNSNNDNPKVEITLPKKKSPFASLKEDLNKKFNPNKIINNEEKDIIYDNNNNNTNSINNKIDNEDNENNEVDNNKRNNSNNDNPKVEITLPKKKSPFASLKEEISKVIKPTNQKGNASKIDMAFLKATIQDTLKQTPTKNDSEQIKRVPTGIEGFDEIIEGGFIKDSNVLVCGGPGSGKSIFAMEFLTKGIDKFNENGIYISFEEEPESLIDDMKRFDWNIEKKVKDKKLALLYYSPDQVDRVLSIGGGPVREVIESINAKRVVIDSITAFTLLYKTTNDKRRALMSLFKTLKKWGCTSILISEQTLLSESHESTIEEYQSEGVIFIYHSKKGDIRERSIEVFKMRATNHSTKINPLKIDSSGITIYPDQNVY
jgi:KaiC/GvpD/RAD55 family RecA-like ATPase